LSLRLPVVLADHLCFGLRLSLYLPDWPLVCLFAFGVAGVVVSVAMLTGWPPLRLAPECWRAGLRAGSLFIVPGQAQAVAGWLVGCCWLAAAPPPPIPGLSFLP